MAHLSPKFRHDVFVSYSHGDVDGTGSSLLKSWSQAFARELEKELRGTPGFHQAAVFLDESKRPEQSLDAADPLTAQIRGAAGATALLLVLMTPRYLTSKWCADERSWWLGEAGREAFPGIESRTLIARVWPTRADNWPTELLDERGHPSLGYFFHPKPGDEIRDRPFDWPDPTGAKGEFRAALVGLVGDIAVRMKAVEQILKERRDAQTLKDRLEMPGGQAIYVHGRVRDHARWDKACVALLDAGYGVFPEKPEDEAAPDPKRDDEAVLQMAGCDAVMIVPGDEARALQTDIVYIGHQRRNSARAKVPKPLPCAVIDPGLTSESLPRIRQSARNLRIDWLDAATPTWTTAVGPWLAAAAGPRG